MWGLWLGKFLQNNTTNNLNYSNMKIWKYKLNKNSDDFNGNGFLIQKENVFVYHKDGTKTKTNKVRYTIWHDPYEGGQAYDSDWSYVTNDDYNNVPMNNEWLSHDDAHKWIVDTYGDITEIEDD